MNIEEFIENHLCDLNYMFLLGCLKHGINETYALNSLKSGNKKEILKVIDLDYLKQRLNLLECQVENFDKEEVDKNCIK